METKNAIVWVVVVILVGGAAYFGYRSYSSTKSPSTTGSESQAANTLPPEQVQGEEITVGTGEEAKPGSVVTVEYEGKLTDGTVFDSSIGKQPLVFTLGAQGIIPGFQVGVNGMKVGGERRLAIPPSLGYGAQQIGTIPPNSTLIFTVKLLKVEPATGETTAPAPAAQ